MRLVLVMFFCSLLAGVCAAQLPGQMAYDSFNGTFYIERFVTPEQGKVLGWENGVLVNKSAGAGVNADWNASSGNALILNKPTLGTLAAQNGTITDYLLSTTAASTYQPLRAVLTGTTASFTTALESKLSGISAGAEVNVNADWNASSGDAQILNKPTLGTLAAQNGTITDYLLSTTAASTYQPLRAVLTGTTASFTTALETKLGGIASGAEVNVNADWNASSGDAQILNKPVLGTMASETATNYLTTATAASTYQPLTAVLTGTTASFTTALESKLSGISAGAEVNVNADWNASSGDAQILNKPTLGTGVATALAVNTGSPGAFLVRGQHGLAPSTPLVDGDIWIGSTGFFAVEPGGTVRQFVDTATNQTIGGNKTFTGSLVLGNFTTTNNILIGTGNLAAGNTRTINIGSGFSNSTSTTTIVIGAGSALGNITLGPTTNTFTLAVGAGATLSGNTKSINIGTAGVEGSTTNIVIGSATGTSTTTLHGSVTGNGSNLTNLNASNLSSGTVSTERLPAPTTTALGGVKRNTGSAGQFVNGIDTDGALQYGTPSGGGGSGDMLKSVYDPRNLNKITGLPGDGPVGVGGGVGGVLNMSGGDSGLLPQSPFGGSGGSAGEIITSGGNGFTSGEIGGDYGGGSGGSINTSGGGASDGQSGLSGGSINTSNGGGSINTSNGGGSIDTTGTGVIELGSSSTRTTLTGTATTGRNINFPNASGTLLLNDGSGASLTGTASGLTAGQATAALGLKTATTTVSISAAAAPTSGQVLTATSGTTATFQTPSGGSSGAMVLLDSATASNSAWIAFDGVFNQDIYSQYRLVVTKLRGATDGVTARLAWRTGVTPRIDIQGSYRFVGYLGLLNAAGSRQEANLQSLDSFPISGGGSANVGNDGNREFSMIADIFLGNDFQNISWKCVYRFGGVSAVQATYDGVGSLETSTTPAGIRFFMSAGGITTGTFTLYGILK